MENTLLDSFTTPVLAVDREFRVQLANEAAGLFWRLRPEQLSGYVVSKLFGKDSAVLQHLTRAFEDEASTSINPCRFDQGRGLPPLNLRVQIDPVLVAHQPVEQALIVFWDQTQRESRESAAQEERLLDSIGSMVERLAHELQNPLSGIKGATQLLARKVTGFPELREYPEVILKELERLERLDEVWGIIEKWTQTHTKFEVLDTLNEIDVPCGPILDMKDLL
ncbi:MAG: CoA transferase, partial [SAR324 cluster bacterium]|nr:CoA transferase [SAR324 cluster bacterium]